MRSRVGPAVPAAISVAVALLFLTFAGKAPADEWVACGDATVVQPSSGVDYRVSALKVAATTCGQGRATVWDFYAQTIGSSGATVANGFGCSYGMGGVEVACQSRSGNTYEGEQQVRWHEERLRNRRARNCGAVATRNGTGAVVKIRAAGTTCQRARDLGRRCAETGRHPGWTVWLTGDVIPPSNTVEVRLVRHGARVTMGWVGGSVGCYPPTGQ